VEKVLIWLVLLFFFFVLPSILQALAKKRAQQAQRAERPEEGEEPAEEDQAYAAEPSDIERYLESIGVKIERRPAPPPPPPPRQPEPPVLRPVEPERYRPPARPEPVQVRLIVAEEEPPPPPSVEPPAAEPAFEQPLAVQEARVAPAPPPAEAPAPAFAALAARPTLADLRRGIVLSEILRRPDLQRLPCDRTLSFGDD